MSRLGLFVILLISFQALGFGHAGNSLVKREGSGFIVPDYISHKEFACVAFKEKGAEHIKAIIKKGEFNLFEKYISQYNLEEYRETVLDSLISELINDTNCPETELLPTARSKHLVYHFPLSSRHGSNLPKEQILYGAIPVFEKKLSGLLMSKMFIPKTFDAQRLALKSHMFFLNEQLPSNKDKSFEFEIKDIDKRSVDVAKAERVYVEYWKTRLASVKNDDVSFFKVGDGYLMGWSRAYSRMNSQTFNDDKLSQQFIDALGVSDSKRVLINKKNNSLIHEMTAFPELQDLLNSYEVTLTVKSHAFERKYLVAQGLSFVDVSGSNIRYVDWSKHFSSSNSLIMNNHFSYDGKDSKIRHAVEKGELLVSFQLRKDGNVVF